MTSKSILLLRVALAFALLYPAVSALFAPLAWVGYLPSWAGVLPVSDMFLLHVFGLVEAVLAFWILSGRQIFIPSAISAVLLFLIVVLNWSQIDVLFRDIPIIFVAVVLAVSSFREKKEVVGVD